MELKIIFKKRDEARRGERTREERRGGEESLRHCPASLHADPGRGRLGLGRQRRPPVLGAPGVQQHRREAGAGACLGRMEDPGLFLCTWWTFRKGESSPCQCPWGTDSAEWPEPGRELSGVREPPKESGERQEPEQGPRREHRDTTETGGQKPSKEMKGQKPRRWGGNQEPSVSTALAPTSGPPGGVHRV